MKKKGSKSDYINERNAELRRRYFDRSAYESRMASNEAMLENAVKSPCSRFWVDPDRARDILSRYRRDPRALDSMLPGRKAMYLELYARYQEIQKANPGMSMIGCVSIAVFSRAPQFFISPATARSIISSRAD